MRLLRYSTLACLLICIMADNEYEESREKPGLRKKPAQRPMPRGRPAERRPHLTKIRGGQGGRHHKCKFNLVQTNCAGGFFCSKVGLQ
uniref:Pancreatic trypsin inhibitor n=1 Tax=Rhipicephalus zambeziensis TaxID=60191 RepID=A0A224YBD0_9ACAR